MVDDRGGDDAALRAEIGRLKRMLDDAAAEHARLTFELGHRVKNTLSVVLALAGQTMRGAATKEEALETFGSRVLALARANDAILKDSWTTTTIRSVAESVLIADGNPTGRFSIDGPEARIEAGAALSFAMALQELATNAKRHGAWSDTHGRVALSWHVEATGPETGLGINWIESGGPAAEPPARRGFGLKLIEQSLRSAFGRDITLSFDSRGLSCRVHAPLDTVVA